MKDIPSLLDKNLQALEKTQPRLASRLRNYLEELPALAEPFFQETPSGRWVSGLTETPFFEKKVFLEKRVNASPSPVYLLFGAGCPPYLFHVLRSLPREALSVIVFEPSLDLLLYTLSQTSVFQALPAGCRISFIIGKERTLIDEVFAWNVVPVGIYPVSKAIAIAHAGESEPAELESFFKKEIIYRLTLLGNSPEDTLLGLRHSVLNTPRTLQSPRISDLAKRYSGKPFVCVATGPSLDKNVHLLREIKEKCVIIACDTVLRRLLEMGIVPHIVTTIERPYAAYISWLPAVLEVYQEQCKEIVLLSQSVSYPLIAGRWPGLNVVIGKLDVPVDNWYMGAILGEQLMYSGLSVSHMAISFALACGASSVSLIGQDLAYGDDGQSHASATVPDSALAVEQQRKRSAISVPGSLGGEVFTTGIWLTFIQIFERIIAATTGTPVYDCTEGGALIEGTHVLPFSCYINEKILDLNESVSRWKTDEAGKRIQYEGVLERFEKAYDQLNRVGSKLEDMRSGIERCGAPALLPAKRQAIAFSVAQILDEIHAMNPVISFIGQSYTYLASTTLSENRFLETVEQVECWKKLHDEILESHSNTLVFLHRWLNYAKETVELMFHENLSNSKGWPGNGEAEFLKLFDTLQTDAPESSREKNAVSIQIADGLSCKDPLREDWSPDGLWKAALLLFTQGRAEEANRFMAKAYEIVEGEQLPAETIGTFFKDWGKIAAADDLCVFPSTAEAMTYLANAQEYLPDDQEIPLLRKQIIQRQRKMYIESAKVSDARKSDIDLLLLRNEAESALLKENLPAALRSVEKLVWESFETHPRTALPHLHWLMKTASNCTEAADKDIASLSAEILDRIITELPKLAGIGIKFPSEFLAYLSRKGVKFIFESSDKKTIEE